MWITQIREGRLMAPSPYVSPLDLLSKSQKVARKCIYSSRRSSKVRLAVRNEIWVVPALRRGARRAIYNILGHLPAKSDPGRTVTYSMAREALVGLILMGLP